jgi:hypothetical protein
VGKEGTGTMSLLETAAREGFNKARLIYAGYTGKGENKERVDEEKRLKSANKLRLDEQHKDREFLSIINENDLWQYADSAHSERMKQVVAKGRPPDKGETLLEMGQKLLGPMGRSYALSCWELTCIVIAVAYERLRKPKPPQVAKVSLKKLADHTFCVVGLPDNLSKIPRVGVKNLENIFTNSDDVWAADPWLNVCCRIASYPKEAQIQLEKWQGDNKRIIWDGLSGDKLGWYTPLGDYAKAFHAATLGIQRV